jgi:hypothetical protein
MKEVKKATTRQAMYINVTLGCFHATIVEVER